MHMAYKVPWVFILFYNHGENQNIVTLYKAYLQYTVNMI